MVPASPDYSAAGKVLAVLGAFGRGHEQLTLTQVARRAGLALSTTHRLVRELAEWGALERGEDGQWHIGLRLWEVASVSPRSPSSIPLVTVSPELTQRVSTATRLFDVSRMKFSGKSS